jgi:hypothetical protein
MNKLRIKPILVYLFVCLFVGVNNILCKNNMRQSLYCVRDKHGKKTIDHQFLAFLPFLLFAAVQYPKIQEEGKQKL